MKKIGKIADWYLWILTALLPMRLGALGLLPGSSSFFPEELGQYVFALWPAVFAGIPVGIGLLLAYLATPAKSKISFAPLTFGWLILFVASFFFGGFFISSPENRLYYYAHFLTLALLLCAIAMRSDANPEFKRGFWIAIMVGTIYSVYTGLNQYWFGFDRLRAHVAEQIAQGAVFSSEYLKRVNDNRIYATFTSCNNFAGYLLLTVPLAGAVIWRFLGQVKPPLASRLIIGIPTIGAMIAVLLLTKSRAAFLTLAIIATASLFCLKIKKTYKIFLASVIVALLAFGAFYIHTRGRGFISMEVRVDYLASSFQMLADHPLLGSGWGEFYYKHQTYMRLTVDEAAHDPHNIVATYASQAGVVGLLGIALMLIWSLVALYRQFKYAQNDKILCGAALIGCALWTVHSLMDSNFMYIASFGLFLGMIAVFSDTSKQKINCRYATHLLIPFAAIISIVAGIYLVRGEYLLEQVRNADKPSALADAYNDAISWRPRSAAVNAIAAHRYLQMNRPGRALELIDLAIICEPEMAALYAEKAEILQQKGDIESAAKLLEKARLLAPKLQINQ